jgi:hypothetical protein
MFIILYFYLSTSILILYILFQTADIPTPIMTDEIPLTENLTPLPSEETSISSDVTSVTSEGSFLLVDDKSDLPSDLSESDLSGLVYIYLYI